MRLHISRIEETEIINGMDLNNVNYDDPNRREEVLAHTSQV
jgi:hypothetical protein